MDEEAQQSFQHPKDSEALRVLMEDSKRRRYEIKKENLDDKGIGRLTDGYRDKDLIKIIRHFMAMASERGLVNANIQRLLHHSMMRWEAGHDFDYGDMGCRLYDDEGPGDQGCLCFIINTMHGKTNRYGKLRIYRVLQAQRC
ncbi:unnamed protein product [Heterosigma akashiwo]